MSATLFGRGVMTQTGGRQRAEAIDNAIKTLRAELAAIQPLVTQVRVLEARVLAAENRAGQLEAEMAKVKATVSATVAPALATTA